MRKNDTIVLDCLRDRGPMTVTEIQEFTNLKAPALHEALMRLRAAGHAQGGRHVETNRFLWGIQKGQS